MGGFKVQGKTNEQAERVLEGARAVAEAGAFAVVLEGVPTDLAACVTAALDVPTIGIGAGPSCDGQVLVSYDLLGLTPNLKPKFVKHYENFFERGKQAVASFCDEVRSGQFPAPQHCFGVTRRPPTSDVVEVVEAVEAPAGAAAGYGPTH
jgi:3-methyl-2-oxobutanoate hydroxymethyltransferase